MATIGTFKKSGNELTGEIVHAHFTVGIDDALIARDFRRRCGQSGIDESARDRFR